MEKEGKPYISMTINSSSADSIKPGFVIEFMCGLKGIELPQNALQITRLDMFTKDENDNLISLGDIGE